ncbi:response regulator [Limnovirga soli]|uniref:Response regulator n=1 Tax=Limnovirga soli TaxID=2656915 RepID=A0A8J8FB11_9BACT|nr:response regulator [Limnovirga soli]NNV54703.1 response regulator [Limnovirga soli]
MNNIHSGFVFNAVMVVDDTFTDRFIAEHYIKLCKMAPRIIMQDSGKNALEYLIENANNKALLPAIIFLDIRMPEMDGFEFLDRFVHLTENIHDHCHIYMLSSSLDPEDFKRVEEYSFVKGFISKPLNVEKINTVTTGVHV